MKAGCYIFCAMLLVSCTGKSTSASNLSSERTDKITVIAHLRYSMSIGYGELYEGKITKVIEGDMFSDQFTLCVMVGDTLVSKKIHSRVINKLTFIREEENVPYHTMPLTGFVDDKMTSWKLVSIGDE